VLPAGGRFYPAKDSVLDREAMTQSWGTDRVDRVLQIKRQLDPEGLFSSNLSRRLIE